MLKLCKKDDVSSPTGSNSGRVIDRDLSRQRETVGNWDRVVNLGGKSTVHVSVGDRLTILTPGGGGYGAPNAKSITSPWDGKVGHVNDPESVPVIQSGSLHQFTLNQES